jgi:hypothetical protein
VPDPEYGNYRNCNYTDNESTNQRINKSTNMTEIRGQNSEMRMRKKEARRSSSEALFYPVVAGLKRSALQVKRSSSEALIKRSEASYGGKTA